jgi:hypothetical protein
MYLRCAPSPRVGWLQVEEAQHRYMTGALG